MDANEVYDCLIVGGGPSGLSAAIYGSRACLKLALIEKELYGGKLNKTLSIENYPGYLSVSGAKLGEDMAKQVEELGVRKYYGNIVEIVKKNGIFHSRDQEGRVYRSRSILIASGMKERVLDIPNVHEYYGRGVSYCAICDGNLYAGRRVIVVGGGNSAVEESMYLSDIVETVELVHRRRQFRADEISVRRMEEIENIKVNVPFIPIEVKVEGDRVIGLVVENVETGERRLIEGECVFFYVGLIPENYFLKGLDVKMDEMGFIMVNGHMETSVRGVFASGDIIHKHLRQVINAASEGAIAAVSIKHYINSLEN